MTNDVIFAIIMAMEHSPDSSQLDNQILVREAAGHPWLEEQIYKREQALDDLLAYKYEGANFGGLDEEELMGIYRYYSDLVLQTKILLGVDDPAPLPLESAD